MSELLTVVGIDNGNSGGLCAISTMNGEIIDRIPMPTYKINDKEEVDTQAVIEFLVGFRYPESLVVGLEEPLKHAKSSQAIRSMAINFGKILGACEAKKIPVRRIQVLDWQKKLLGKMVPKGMTKAYALREARRLWPNENWLAGPRCRTPHDGIVDSALIALYTLSLVKP